MSRRRICLVVEMDAAAAALQSLQAEIQQFDQLAASGRSIADSAATLVLGLRQRFAEFERAYNASTPAECDCCEPGAKPSPLLAQRYADALAVVRNCVDHIPESDPFKGTVSGWLAQQLRR